MCTEHPMRVTIQEVATGRTVSYDEDWELYGTYPDWPPFIWMPDQGNYGCDCNRRLFFIREAEQREPEDDETPCTKGQYRVRLAYKDQMYDEGIA